MKAEEQILELLAEVLRKQDQMQATQDQMQGQIGTITQTLQSHQQLLRTLATEQQRQGQRQDDMQEALESIARMQRNQNRRLDRLEHPGDFV